MNQQDTSFGLLATTRYLPRLRLERSQMLTQHQWMAPGLRSLAKGRLSAAERGAIAGRLTAGRRHGHRFPRYRAVRPDRLYLFTVGGGARRRCHPAGRCATI